METGAGGEEPGPLASLLGGWPYECPVTAALPPCRPVAPRGSRQSAGLLFPQVGGEQGAESQCSRACLLHGLSSPVTSAPTGLYFATAEEEAVLLLKPFTAPGVDRSVSEAGGDPERSSLALSVDHFLFSYFNGLPGKVFLLPVQFVVGKPSPLARALTPLRRPPLPHVTAAGHCCAGKPAGAPGFSRRKRSKSQGSYNDRGAHSDVPLHSHPAASTLASPSAKTFFPGVRPGFAAVLLSQ